jgi:ectoine hydroxylase-related dioxygenase (phytanoyl-CoA dioxygenase family)
MTTTPIRTPGWLRRQDCRLEDLLEVLSDRTTLDDYPHAARVEQDVLVYDWSGLAPTVARADGRREVQAEITRALADGPGIVVLTGAFDAPVVDRTSAAFRRMIEEQRTSGVRAGDHFAQPGANDRVWNALEKLAVTAPQVFADYYGSDVVDLVATAWLGAGYQVTSQLNVVNPGGAGQTVHRDYHLGFQSPDVSERFPAHVHRLSPVLTLQGAVAHVDMPVESGPTLYLPHSQKYEPGYLAYWLDDFQTYFVEHHVQLPLTKGDAVFFNPALMHAAGSNRSSDVRRMANLLQVSSAFGRAMETVDRAHVVRALYPTLLERVAADGITREVRNAVAASAEGYAFPTNLDRDQPVDGMAPPSQAEIVLAALAEAVPADEVDRRLTQQVERTRSH